MKVMVGLIISILIISVLMLFWPSSQTSVNNVSVNEDINELHVATEVTEEQDTSSSLELSPASDDEKVALMTAEYQVLEKARKKLKQRLARLKHDMWGVKFSPENAKQISEIMLNAHKLIKNPDMLGAFSNVDGIQYEIVKVNFADKSLDLVDEMLEQNKKDNNDAA